MVPRAVARRAVRSMRASISRSIRQFTAKAAAANIQMPSVAATTLPASGSPGVARNMPITAQNTASWVTRGLVSTRYCRSRLCDCGLSVVMGYSLLGTIIKASTNCGAGQDQAGSAAVMQYGDGQWPFKENCCQTGEPLCREQGNDEPRRASQSGGAQHQPR